MGNVITEKGGVCKRCLPENYVDEHKDIFEHEFQKNIPEAHRLLLRNVFILDDIVFSALKIKFYSSYSKKISQSFLSLIKRLKYFLNPGNKISKAIWITDDWSGGYFHWFGDALPRLLSMKDNLTDHKILLPESYRYQKYISQSLDILGYNYHYFNKHSSLFIKTLLLPSHLAPSGNYNEKIMLKLRKAFVGGVKKKGLRKIYISRAKAGKRICLNEKEVTSLLVNNGFEVHFFEDYDLLKQIEIMQKAAVLVALHGEALTTMLFMQHEGKVIELRNKYDLTNNCFYSLASALDLQYYYLLNEADSKDGHVANITVDINRLEKLIE